MFLQPNFSLLISVIEGEWSRIFRSVLVGFLDIYANEWRQPIAVGRYHHIQSFKP
jgi:hypothetical protein